MFSAAHSHNVITLPSHTNILTGMLPVPARRARERRLPAVAEDPDGGDALKAKGYATGAFVGAYVLDSRYGLAHDFDVYNELYRHLDEQFEFDIQQAQRRGRRQGRARVVPVAAGQAALSLGARLRSARALRAAAGVQGSLSRRLLPGRGRLHGRLARAAARGPHGASSRRRSLVVTGDHGEGPRRSRRADARPLLLRGDAARPALRVVPRASSCPDGTQCPRGTSTSCRRCSTRSGETPAKDLHGPVAASGGPRGSARGQLLRSALGRVQPGLGAPAGTRVARRQVHRPADPGALRASDGPRRGEEPRLRRPRTRCAACASGCSSCPAARSSAGRSARRRRRSCAASAT